MFKHCSFHRYRFGDEILTKKVDGKVLLILSGQCVMIDRGAINLITGDYINL